jgi:hypothetical protein
MSEERRNGDQQRRDPHQAAYPVGTGLKDRRSLRDRRSETRAQSDTSGHPLIREEKRAYERRQDEDMSLLNPANPLSPLSPLSPISPLSVINNGYNADTVASPGGCAYDSGSSNGSDSGGSCGGGD